MCQAFINGPIQQQRKVFDCFQLPEQQANQKVLVSAKIRQPYYTALSQYIYISSTDQRQCFQHNANLHTNLHSRILETFTATWWASTTVPLTVLSFTQFVNLSMIAVEVVSQTQTRWTLANSRLHQRCPLAQEGHGPSRSDLNRMREAAQLSLGKGDAKDKSDSLKAQSRPWIFSLCLGLEL